MRNQAITALAILVTLGGVSTALADGFGVHVGYGRGYYGGCGPAYYYDPVVYVRPAPVFVHDYYAPAVVYRSYPRYVHRPVYYGGGYSKHYYRGSRGFRASVYYRD